MSSLFGNESAPPCPRGLAPPDAWARRVRHRAPHNDRGRLCLPYGLLALLLVLSVVTAARTQPMQSEVAQRFVGMWRYVGTTIDGRPRPNRGANPKGYIF